MSGKLKVLAAGGIAFLVLIVVVFVLLRTTAKDIANDFLAMIGRGEVEEAYGFISPDMRAVQNLDVFERRVEEMNLVNFASVSWDRVDKEEKLVKLTGSVQTKAGEKFPIEMTLVMGADGSWLVSQFGPPAPPPSAPPADPPEAPPAP